MAFELTWSSAASEDLAEFHAFILRDSLMYAVGCVQRVINKAESLAEMPERGRVVPEYADPAVREVIVGNYGLVYRIWADIIGIVGVIHGARVMPIR
ncbi:MAG: type II toxin-antitoxin system RelE/ParE family toxin [Planctomycetes bacterium]|nr:type II toxin-antitoxin system RelE/ParE family toxin [Planctomycetota bacterium]